MKVHHRHRHRLVNRTVRTAPRPVDHATWLRLVHEQLGQTLDEGVVPLGKEGARSAILKATLLQYGYTFVAKATVEEFIVDLEHEADIYQTLERLQGVDIPVFLGTADLRPMSRTYFYAPGVRIVYMLLFSWGGNTIPHPVAATMPEQDVVNQAEEQAVVDLITRIHALGVLHGDVRHENFLQNPETSRFIVIDFERSVNVDLRRRSPRIIRSASPVSASSHPLAAMDIASARMMVRGHASL